MIQALIDYYRIKTDPLTCMVESDDHLSGDVGFFRFGPDNICYGHCKYGTAASLPGSHQLDVYQKIVRRGSSIHLPFDFNQVVDNLRMERYRHAVTPSKESLVASAGTNKMYYLFRDWIPARIRRQLHRAYFRGWQDLQFPAWPVDFTVDRLHEKLLVLLMEASGVSKVPFVWFWPAGSAGCLMLTHDVESKVGQRFTSRLLDLDDSYGFKASVQVIPEDRYAVSDDYINEIRKRGFECNVHDLNHDGYLYRERSEFLRRAAKINSYLGKYGARGFRSGAMYRNQEWFDAFDFSYDMSVPNVAHLEPMRGGCCTVMPYFVGKILELPLTLAQDYSIFYILNDNSLELWKQQLALIKQRHGLMSCIIHPDYVADRRVRKGYEELLAYLREWMGDGNIWPALPGEIDLWWRARNRMEIVERGGDWEIVGPESSRARLAYAVLDEGRVRYEMA